MNRNALTRLALGLITGIVLTLSPTDASAQGSCSCNSGCHRYPGQCVMQGSNGCQAGYAPFCGTRAASCPQTGWVSCNGACTCVRIGPVDAGTIPGDATTATDAPGPTADTPGADAVTGPDVGSPMPDASLPRDATVLADVPRPPVDGAPDDVRVNDGATVDRPAVPGDTPFTPTDTPFIRADTPLPSTDAPFTPSDTPSPSTDALNPSSDTPLASSDAPFTPTDIPSVSIDSSSILMDASPVLPDGGVAPDADCACDGGVCLNGTCLTTRCAYQNELGFLCPIPGQVCRIVGDEAWCVPPCIDVTCAAGEVCDPNTSTCVADRCGTMLCAAGTVCRAGACIPTGDGGAGDGSTAPPTAGADGCGCRARTRTRGGTGLILAFALVACARRRRRAA